MKGVFTHPFTKFVAKKVVFYVAVTFVAVTLVFFIPRLMPGNPVDQMIHPSNGQQLGGGADYLKLRAALIAYFGMDKPLFDQYISYWGKFLTLNLGPRTR